MTLQPHHGGLPIVHVEAECAPAALRRANGAHVLVQLDLVDAAIGALANSNHGAVWALVNVLVEILDAAD